MIIAEDVTATIEVDRSELRANERRYSDQVIAELNEKIEGLGGRTVGLHIAVETCDDRCPMWGSSDVPLDRAVSELE